MGERVAVPMMINEIKNAKQGDILVFDGKRWVPATFDNIAEKITAKIDKVSDDTQKALIPVSKKIEDLEKETLEFEKSYKKTIDIVNSFLNPTVVHSMAVLDTNGHIVKIVPFHMALLAENEPIPKDIANGYYKILDNHIVVDEALKEAYHSLE